MLTEVVHVLLAGLLFFLVNWVGGHSISSGYHQISLFEKVEDAPAFNVLFRVIAPLVFMILTAAIWYTFGLDDFVRNYYTITIYYFLLRWLFNVLVGRALLIHWWRQLALALVTVMLSVGVYRAVLTSRTLLLPDPKQLRDQLWIIVILFLYHVVNRVSPIGGHDYVARRAAYVRAKYKAFRARFGDIVTAETQEQPLEVLAYAVLMYESFNRPPIYQFIESYILYPMGLSRTFGPMQFRSTTRLSADESVTLGIRKLKRDFAASNVEVYGPEVESGGTSGNWWDRKKVIDMTARKYNIRSDYAHKVSGLFDQIADRYYPDLRGVWVGLG